MNLTKSTKKSSESAPSLRKKLEQSTPNKQAQLAMLLRAKEQMLKQK